MATVERPTIGNHAVVNQPPPLADYNVFDADTVLVEAVKREGAEWDRERISAAGEYAGSEAAQELGRLANENPPKLKTHDRYGHRVDEVEFHPYWHDLMRTAVSHGLAGAPWRQDPAHPAPHAHVRRAVGYLGWTQVEMGHGCPTTMTYAVVPAL
ncbi:MAG TPA: DNA alkylation response protein, partial [Solirubrobacterales bacterium]